MGRQSIQPGIKSRNRRPSSTRRPADGSRFSMLELLENRTLMSAATVNTTADDGTIGSLRWAIAQVNAGTSDGINTILAAGQTISLQSQLPAITRTVDIEWSSGVDISDGAMTGISIGLELDGNSSIVRGLSIDGFGASDLTLRGNGDTIQGNSIGNHTVGGNADGIDVFGDNTLIGGSPAATRNVISGAGNDGITIHGNNTQVRGNYIGVDATGETALPNNNNGITVDAIDVNGNIDPTRSVTGTVIVGNVISGNNGYGIQLIGANGATISGNIIGLDATGTATFRISSPLLYRGNGSGGIEMENSSNVHIGSALSTDRNIISGNTSNGIQLVDSSNNTIQGNLIGTDITGKLFTDAAGEYFGNDGDGIRIIASSANSSGNLIGGTGAGMGNLISGGGSDGIHIATLVDSSAANLIQGNLIGTDITGDHALLNFGDGVAILGGKVTIGGTAAGAGNIISGNGQYGVSTTSDPATVVIQGNLIGVTKDGHLALGNGSADGKHKGGGISLQNSGTVIGGAGGANTIAFNYGNGVTVAAGTGNSIRQNSIYANTGIGIDLGDDGVTPNSNLRTGPNNGQNYPVIDPTSVVRSGTTVTLSGALSAPAGSSFILEFFTNPDAGTGISVQGETYAGSVTISTDVNGIATFSVTLTGVAADQTFVTATATDVTNDTSEFSTAASIPPSIGPVALIATTTTVSSSSATLSSAAHEVVTYTAIVSHTSGTDVPSGSVIFYDNGVSIGTGVLQSNGSYKLTTTAAQMTVGNHSITASYSGDTEYAASNSTPIVQAVHRNATKTVLISSVGTVTFGTSVTLTATVSNIDTGTGAFTGGTVVFMDGSTALGSGSVSVNSSGVATLTISTLSVGTHTIIATFNGNTDLAGSSSLPTTVKVSAQAASISGHTLNDVSGDGLSADDTLLANVKVNIYRESGRTAGFDSSDTLAGTMTTGADGSYSFGNLAAGTYYVQEVVPTGYVLTAPTLSTFYTVTFNGSQSQAGFDFDQYHKGCTCDIQSITYTVISGGYSRSYTDLRGHVHEGDTVKALFSVLPGHLATVSLVSYTCPAASFDANTASQQKVYDFQTYTYSNTTTRTETFCETVIVPPSYFQVDFVCGYVIGKFGPAGSNIFYSAEGRLFSADNGGVHKATTVLPLHSLPANYP